MNIKPDITVILPIYNEPIDWIIQCLESILDQTFSNFEVIAILDKPDNKEVAFLLDDYSQKDNRIRVIFNENNLGLPNTLNRGINYSIGKYIARMDADDICNKNRFEKQYDFLTKNPDIDLVGCNACAINETGNKVKKDRRPRHHKNIIKYLKWGSPVVHSTWMGKSCVFKKIAYKNLLSVEDYDFLCRAVLKGYKLANLTKYLLKFRIRDDGISKKNSFRQLITTINISYAFRKAIKKKNDHYNDNQFKYKEVSEQEIERYTIAEEKILNAIYLFRNKNYVKSLLQTIIALEKSRYIFYKIFRRIILNIIIIMDYKLDWKK